MIDESMPDIQVNLHAEYTCQLYILFRVPISGERGTYIVHTYIILYVHNLRPES